MLKKVFWTIEDLKWNVSCRYNFWLHGPYGLAKVIEKMPFHFIIKYLRRYGAKIGDNCIIDSGIKLHRPAKNNPFANMVIGNNVYVGHNILFDLSDKVVLEDDTALAAGCQIWTHTGYWDKNLRDNNDYYEDTGSVLMKKSSVCYANTILNPGVTIGERSRIYAMSMINKSVPDNEVWAGTPAAYIKKRD